MSIYEDLDKFYKKRSKDKNEQVLKQEVKKEEEKEKKEEAKKEVKEVKEEIKEIRKPSRQEREQKYWLQLMHKNVELKLIDGTIIKGILHTSKWTRYDIKIENENGIMLIPKHSILWIKEVSS
jgi:type IV secretory pathway VirB10-like protein